MAKNASATDPSQGAAPTAAHKPKAFARGLFSINTKFSAFMGVLLLLLLMLVSLVVNSQLRLDLTREVAERGNSVTRNIAGKCLELLVGERADDLIAYLLAKG